MVSLITTSFFFFRWPEYQGGCVGVAVLEKCGDESLAIFIDTFVSVLESVIDLRTKTMLCYSETTQTIKTSIIEGLNMTESHKSVYRAIFDMDKGKRNRGNLLINNYYLQLLMIFFVYSTVKYI